jgi:hypothetical protein
MLRHLGGSLRERAVPAALAATAEEVRRYDAGLRAARERWEAQAEARRRGR